MQRRASYLVFGQPRIEEPEIEEVVATLRSGWLGTGPKAAELERRFAAYCQVPDAVAVSSCTAALHLSLQAIGAGPGRAVITTPFTFAATLNAILHTGARPILIDIEQRSMNIDVAAIAALLESCLVDPGSGRPRDPVTGLEIVGIVPVHFAGRPCEMDGIETLAQRYRLAVIEDAAHAIEAWYHGRKIGGIGDFGCFSFYATKSMTTGEGGMITVRSTEQAQLLRALALQGLSRDAWARSGETNRDYRVIAPGFKYNLTDIAASIGLHQLKRLDTSLARRTEVWRRYDEAFRDLPVELPMPPEPDTVHARHLYTLLIDRQHAGIDRDQFRQQLHDWGIGTGVHFVSLHLHDFYRGYFGCRPEDFPAALHVSERTVSLPLTAYLSDEDVADVIEATRTLLAR